MIERVKTMTVAEFVRLYDAEGPFEIINGEIVKVSPTVAGHGDKAKTLYDAILIFDPQKTRVAAYFDSPFVLLESSDWVRGSRVPDIMVFHADRIARYKAENPDWEDKPFALVPDLVVEVISTHDNYTDVDAKVERYLDDGVQVVWVVDPRRKTIKVQRQGTYRTLHVGDTLTGDEVIPGFELTLQAIFA
ncbi:MAG: Uma2 family endonuclease [Chloroflexi bacterium]|nr:Uma2 family endonuclease [Chloroflexota bacterium]